MFSRQAIIPKFSCALALAFVFLIPNNLHASNPKIAAGQYYSLAVKTDGTLWGWGGNSFGQLGDGTTINRHLPVQIGTGFSDIAAFYRHSLALKSDGTLWAWGDNWRGTLGDGTTTDRHSPVQIGTGFSKIAAGGNHSLALKSDGTLWAWGYNYYGQLGDGTTTDRYSPVQIGTGFSKIAAGFSHSLALNSDGTLWAWGDNPNGQLGDGTTTDRYFPVQIGTGFSDLAAGAFHSLAIKSDGNLWAWGHNDRGQLGDGTTTDRHSPVQIGNGFSKIDASWGHSLALKSDGTLWAWGENPAGQLGDGTTTERHSPVQIETGFSNIAVGYRVHSLAFKADGTLWAWGYNSNGQLGDGTTTERHSPVQVNGFGLKANLKVIIEPFNAAFEGVKWSLREKPVSEIESGQTFFGLAPGTSTIHFIGAPGWAVPLDYRIELEGGTTTTLTFTCSEDPIGEDPILDDAHCVGFNKDFYVFELATTPEGEIPESDIDTLSVQISNVMVGLFDSYISPTSFISSFVIPGFDSLDKLTVRFLQALGVSNESQIVIFDNEGNEIKSQHQETINDVIYPVVYLRTGLAGSTKPIKIQITPLDENKNPGQEKFTLETDIMTNLKPHNVYALLPRTTTLKLVSEHWTFTQKANGIQGVTIQENGLYQIQLATTLIEPPIGISEFELEYVNSSAVSTSIVPIINLLLNSDNH